MESKVSGSGDELEREREREKEREKAERFVGRRAGEKVLTCRSR